MVRHLISGAVESTLSTKTTRATGSPTTGATRNATAAMTAWAESDLKGIMNLDDFILGIVK
jgi:hypothetical protein